MKTKTEKKITFSRKKRVQLEKGKKSLPPSQSVSKEEGSAQEVAKSALEASSEERGKKKEKKNDIFFPQGEEKRREEGDGRKEKNK